MTEFMIFADTRTGSWNLFKAIQSTYQKRMHQSLVSISEPFNPRVIKYFYSYEVYKYLYEEKMTYESDPYKWMDKEQVIDIDRNDWSSAEQILNKCYEVGYGIKHIWSHLNKPLNKKLLKYAADNNKKIIFLEREGVVKKTLSHMLSEQTSQWQKYSEEPVFEKVDLLRLDLLVKRYINDTHQYKQYIDEAFYLKYENLFNLPEKKQRMDKIYEILEYLDMPKDFFDPKLFKTLLSPKLKMNKKDTLLKVPNIKEVDEYAQKFYNEKVIEA